MTELPRRNSREIDNLLHSGLLAIDRLMEQMKTGKIDAKLFVQRMTSVQDTLNKVAEDRKYSVQNERLARVYMVSRLISSSLELQSVLDQVMDAIIQLTNAERGFLMLLENGNLDIRVARNFDQETLSSDGLSVSRSITNRVMQEGHAIVTTNAQEDPRFAGQASIVANSLSSILASPLRIRDQIIGVIYVDNRALTGLFSEDDRQLLDMFGEQAAIAIDNAIQVQQREHVLKAQIEELRIEIDQAKKEKQVAEIVESEYFDVLRQKAAQARSRSARQNTPPTDGSTG